MRTRMPAVAATLLSVTLAAGLTVGQAGTAAAATDKATSYAYLTTVRKGSAMYVDGLIKQSSPAGIVRSAHRTVYLQRELTSGWQTVLSRTTDIHGLFAVGFISVPAYQYRLVVPASTSALATVSGTVTSSPQVVRYPNCAAVHAVPTYAHGIGRPGAIDKVSGGGAGVTSYFRSTALYQANATSLDRDHDGIACEVH